MRVEFALPLPSRANGRGRSIAHARLERVQREAARLAIQGSNESFVFPVVVVLTRIYGGTKPLDPFENLPMSLKSVKDGICDAFGVGDGAYETRVTFRAAQERLPGLKGQRVRIEVTSCR